MEAVLSAVRCFWLEPTDQAQIWLRRCVIGALCAVSGHGYHNAQSHIEDRAAKFAEGGCLDVIEQPRDDARWPATCACGHVFAPGDIWQCNQELIYRRLDTGEPVTLANAPAGAMWNAWWIAQGHEYCGPGSWVGPDGMALMVRTPAGDWCVDQPAGNGAGWERSGVVPNITARPSIVVGSPERYHGWLTNGELVPC